MNLLAKLFGTKKNSELSFEEKEQQKRTRDGFDFFQKGHEFYFDKAFESGFVENFPDDASNFYDLRAACLQEFGYDYDAIDDFDISIKLSPNDCNKYFSRSISKNAVLDYEGAILYLQKAIEVSVLDNEHNKTFNEQALEQGFQGGACEYYQLSLVRARMYLEEDLQSVQRIKDSSSQNDKQFWQDLYDQRKNKKLNRIKRR